MIMLGLSVAFVVIPLAISMVLDQILIVLGLFSAVSGCLVFLVTPVLLIMRYPLFVPAKYTKARSILTKRGRFQKEDEPQILAL